MSPTKYISLKNELEVLLSALDGTKLLFEKVQEFGSGDSDYAVALDAGLASLSMLRARMQLLARAVGGEMEPYFLMTPENSLSSEEEVGQEVLRLREAVQDYVPRLPGLMS